MPLEVEYEYIAVADAEERLIRAMAILLTEEEL